MAGEPEHFPRFEMNFDNLTRHYRPVNSYTIINIGVIFDRRESSTNKINGH